MSVFNIFRDRAEQLEPEGQESVLKDTAQTYQRQTNDANQLLRDKQALERETRQSASACAKSA
jgi:hypothetical protein